MSKFLKYNIGEVVVHEHSGSHFTIVDRHQKGVLFYKCSVCSEDAELFPDGIFKSYVSILNSGGSSCGCSIKPQWSEQQNIVRVTRVCKERGYTFLGWSGNYIGDKTYLSLENILTGFRWESTHLSSFLQLKGGDPNQRSIECTKSLTIPDDIQIKSFMSTGKYHNDCKFYRSTSDKWVYECPICSIDEYVQAGVCSGKWERTSHEWKSGVLPCRCNPSCVYTQEQWDYRLNKVSSERGHIFLKYDKPSRTVHWMCILGHEHTSSVNNYITGIDCNQVSSYKNSMDTKIKFGFYPNRKDEKDYLYILTKPNSNIFKIGRSFTPVKRCDNINREYNLDYGIFKLYSNTHKNVHKLEQEVLYKFNSFRKRTTYTTECLSNEVLNKVINYIEENICSHGWENCSEPIKQQQV